jgi:hypothetical protein
LLPTLDIGSHINASLQLLPEAGARDERTLEAVSCKALFGVSSGRGMKLPLSRMTSGFLYACEVQRTSRTDRESQSGPSFYWAT